MTREIICARCGKEIITQWPRAKYCPECAVIVRREYNKDYAKTYSRKKKTDETKWKDLGTLDTPENVKACLECAMMRCAQGAAGCNWSGKGGIDKT